MRHLWIRVVPVILWLLCSSTAHGDEGLSLLLRFPQEPIALGEPFRFQVLVANRSDAAIPMVPLFFFGRNLLHLELVSEEGEKIQGPSGTADFWSETIEEAYTLLKPGSVVGGDLVVSPRLSESINYITGFKEGCYSVVATLRLIAFKEQVQWSRLAPPVETSLDSTPATVCFSAAKEESIFEHLKKLASQDVVLRTESFLYFANVQDQRGSVALRDALGPVSDWPKRCVDPYHALKALSHQADPANLPYFREVLDGQFSSLARSAIDMIERLPP